MNVKMGTEYIMHPLGHKILEVYIYIKNLGDSRALSGLNILV